VLLVPNHRVIVPTTTDLAVEVNGIVHDPADRVYIELYGDSIMCGSDPDLADDPCGCNSRSIEGRVPQPPARLIETFLPQYKLVITSRSSGLSTAAELLDGNDGVNGPWPDYQEANVVVINHGLNDARYDVPVEEYESTLRELREKLPTNTVMVWQTPTVARGIDTTEYAAAMRRVAADYNDILADAHKISRWLGELPDGVHPRQLGYVELVDLCLASAINQAIIKHLGVESEIHHKFLRKDYQEKHVLEEQNWVQLGFKPKSHSWVEVYHRDNISYRAVSRGYLDTKGILTPGVWNGDTSVKLVDTGRSYNFTKIKRDSGKIVYNKNYDVFGDVEQANQLANDLNETNSDYIVVITTNDEPKTNRLTQRLADAMYRCGASVDIYGSDKFKYRSSYVLVGVPGQGAGKGLEAYSGIVDGLPEIIANLSVTTKRVETPDRKFYKQGGTNQSWSTLLNNYSVWEEELSADVVDSVRTVDGVFAGDSDSTTIKSDGLLNIGGVTPVARWFVMQSGEIKEIVEPVAASITSVNTFVVETPDCADTGMQFGIQGISYVSTASVPKLQLTADVLRPFTIEAVVWPLEGGGGGMIINKDSEYEMALNTDGNIMVALDWGVGTDTSLPGGGWYYTNVNVPWNTRSHIAWVVDNDKFYLYLNGLLVHMETGLDRINSPSSNPVVIGNRPGEGQQFTGYIIDVRIWDLGFGALDFNITKNYLELTDVPFYVGIAPMLENFVPDNGTKPTDDLVIIGSAVTENELLTYGIYSTITDLFRGSPGTEISWTADFTAEKDIKIGYWQWDIRRYPTVTVPNILYENQYTSRTTDTASGSFVLDQSFTEKSIIVLGVGDWDPVAPTGLQDVNLEITGIGNQIVWSGDYYTWQVFIPATGNYKFSLGADNRAFLDIRPDRTSVPYERVVSALDRCKQYESVAESVYTIPKCGWYSVRIYAENERDRILAPRYYTGYQVFVPTWSSLLRTHAIEGGASRQWELYLSGDVYTIEISATVDGIVRFLKQDSSFPEQDNSDAIILDEKFSTLVSCDAFEPGPNPKNAVTIFSSTRTLTRGWYIINVNSGSTSQTFPPNFVAARIKNKAGVTVWSTRSPINPRTLDKKSVAASITAMSGRMIWNSRNSYNERDFNEFNRERVIDPTATYSEIEFELAPNGMPFPIDIHPPRPEYLNIGVEIDEIKLMRPSPSYDIVSNVPPINGTRMINARYNKLDFAAATDTFSITHDNRLVFNRPLSGVITVVSDNTYLMPKNSVQVDFTNLQSIEYYRQRFNPARYAAGYDFAADPDTTFGVAATGNNAPKQANSVTMTTQVLASANVYNSGLNKRVGASHFAEPLVLSQPQHGYAKISNDRTSIVYVPFPDYIGLDSFSYTLLSQHGQAGIPKGIYVEVVKEVIPTPPPPPPPPKAITVTPISDRITETARYFQWTITSTANVDVVFSYQGTVTARRDYIDTMSYASLSNAATSVFTIISERTPVKLTDPSYVVRIGPIINDISGEEEEFMTLSVLEIDTRVVTTSTIGIVDG
jgi:lysophospholipase L1-like esterase